MAQKSGSWALLLCVWSMLDVGRFAFPDLDQQLVRCRAHRVPKRPHGNNSCAVDTGRPPRRSIQTPVSLFVEPKLSNRQTNVDGELWTYVAGVVVTCLTKFLSFQSTLEAPSALSHSRQ